MAASDSYTSCLVHADGTDGSTDIVDSSTYGLALTAYTGCQLDTAQKKFGVSSLSFDGSSYLSVAHNAVMAFGTGEWCLDYWVRWRNLPGATSYLVSAGCGPGGGPDAGNGASTSWYNPTNVAPGYTDTQYTSYSWNPSAGVWYHCAFSRDSSNNIRFFVNGTAIGSPWNKTNNNTNSNPSFWGKNPTGTNANYFDGWLDEVRISKGAARYTTNFTPPTEPYESSDQGGTGNMFAMF
jgi:hypothetical protein